MLGRIMNALHSRGALALMALSPALLFALVWIGTSSLRTGLAACALVGSNIWLGRAVHARCEGHLKAAESRYREAEALSAAAHQDPITGLANRAGFDAALLRLVEHLLPDEKLALMWIDLRRFRDINLTLGHALGDDILRQVANRLQGNAPDDALIARFANDKFLLAAPLSSPDQAHDLAFDIAHTLAQPLRIEGHCINNGAAVGVAVMPGDAKNAEQLVEAADLALYHARREPSPKPCFFDRRMTRALARRKQIEADLRDAVLMDELSVVFLPIADVRSGRIAAFEAQLRWSTPDRGEVTPGEFLPVAEESALSVTLGNWLVAEAAKAASAWPDDISLNIRLSSMQMKAPGAALGVISALGKARLAPMRLQITVAEALGGGGARTEAFVEQVSNMGVRFAFDDHTEPSPDRHQSEVAITADMAARLLRQDEDELADPDHLARRNAAGW